VLGLQDIPNQQKIAQLLTYCGYNHYAARVSQHSSQAPTITPMVTDVELLEALDVA